jgi:hypothetical protein
MDLSQLTGSTASSAGVQGMNGGGHHHRHKSISDQVNQMGTMIDNAAHAGKLSSDQAATLKNELADITKIMSQNTQTSSAADAVLTNKTNPLSQLSDDDRKKIFNELQDVRKQLKTALAPQGSSASGSTDSVSRMFSQIDADNNGAISKDEFTNFLAQVGANALGYTQQGNQNTAYSALAGANFSALA